MNSEKGEEPKAIECPVCHGKYRRPPHNECPRCRNNPDISKKEWAIRNSLHDLIPEYFAKKNMKAIMIPSQSRSNCIFFKTDKGNGAIDLKTLDLNGSIEAAEDYITQVVLPKIEALWMR